MRTWLIASLVFVLAAGGALALLAATGPEDRTIPDVPEVTVETDEPDPLAFEPGASRTLRRAPRPATATSSTRSARAG